MALIVLHELGHFRRGEGRRDARGALSRCFFPAEARSASNAARPSTRSVRSPAGGYVKITGMSPIELGLLDLRVADRAYYMQQPWKRIVVILAGPRCEPADRVLHLLGSAAGRLAERLDRARKPQTRRCRRRCPAHRCWRSNPASPPPAGCVSATASFAIDGKPATIESARAARIDTHRCAGGADQGLPGRLFPVAVTVLRSGRRLTLSIYPALQPAGEADADRLRLRLAAVVRGRGGLPARRSARCGTRRPGRSTGLRPRP